MTIEGLLCPKQRSFSSLFSSESPVRKLYYSHFAKRNGLRGVSNRCNFVNDDSVSEHFNFKALGPPLGGDRLQAIKQMLSLGKRDKDLGSSHSSRS